MNDTTTLDAGSMDESAPLDAAFIVNHESQMTHERVGPCAACWGGWPVPCACGGQVHGEFFDESDDNVILVKRCTACADPDPRED